MLRFHPDRQLSEPLADRHKVGEGIVERGPHAVPSRPCGLVEELSEPLSPSTVEDGANHLRHPPSLIASLRRGRAAGWWATATAVRHADGRTRTNGARRRLVTATGGSL
ncbi:hypothetical protein GCM10010170_082370 [Dactylosporangium salmoneum]|uniref:Uncharacterized protein n=1 Tax=Dactylosporangium salmoneum TaxID=53361 RepID=A0ABN3HE86_9ACTN